MQHIKLTVLAFFVFIFASCKKESATPALATTQQTVLKNFTDYLIRAGQQYCDQSIYKATTVTSMSFIVKFDSSAIYTTLDPVNQYDINKLYGFSDGNNHQFNSARIGWSYNDQALRLYAYTYFNGLRQSSEITTVSFGAEVNCSIRAASDRYVFIVNGIEVTMPRALSVIPSIGYQLYPYFGGDESAPHDIHIFLREL